MSSASTVPSWSPRQPLIASTQTTLDTKHDLTPNNLGRRKKTQDNQPQGTETNGPEKPWRHKNPAHQKNTENKPRDSKPGDENPSDLNIVSRLRNLNTVKLTQKRENLDTSKT